MAVIPCIDMKTERLSALVSVNKETVEMNSVPAVNQKNELSEIKINTDQEVVDVEQENYEAVPDLTISDE